MDDGENMGHSDETIKPFKGNARGALNLNSGELTRSWNSTSHFYGRPMRYHSREVLKRMGLAFASASRDISEFEKLLLTHLTCLYNTVKEAPIRKKHKLQAGLKDRETQSLPVCYSVNRETYGAISPICRPNINTL